MTLVVYGCKAFLGKYIKKNFIWRNRQAMTRNSLPPVLPPQVYCQSINIEEEPVSGTNNKNS